jgi:hypothetical protein
MSSLKLEKMALGISFKMNFSFPDLNSVSAPTEAVHRYPGRDGVIQVARTLPARRDPDAASPELVAEKDSDVQKRQLLRCMRMPCCGLTKRKVRKTPEQLLLTAPSPSSSSLDYIAKTRHSPAMPKILGF